MTQHISNALSHGGGMNIIRRFFLSAVLKKMLFIGCILSVVVTPSAVFSDDGNLEPSSRSILDALGYNFDELSDRVDNHTSFTGSSARQESPIGFDPIMGARTEDFMLSKLFMQQVPTRWWNLRFPNGRTLDEMFRSIKFLSPVTKGLGRHLNPLIGHLLWKIGCDAGFNTIPSVYKVAEGRSPFLSRDFSKWAQFRAVVAAYAVYTITRYGSQLAVREVMTPTLERMWKRFFGRELFARRIVEGGEVKYSREFSDKWARRLAWFYEHDGGYFGPVYNIKAVFDQWLDIAIGTYVSWSAFDVAYMFGQTGEINLYPFKGVNFPRTIGLTAGGYLGGAWGYLLGENLMNRAVLPAAVKGVDGLSAILERRARDAGRLEEFYAREGMWLGKLRGRLISNPYGRWAGRAGFVLLGGWLAYHLSDSLQAWVFTSEADPSAFSFGAVPYELDEGDTMPEPEDLVFDDSIDKYLNAVADWSMENSDLTSMALMARHLSYLLVGIYAQSRAAEFLLDSPKYKSRVENVVDALSNAASVKKRDIKNYLTYSPSVSEIKEVVDEGVRLYSSPSMGVVAAAILSLLHSGLVHERSELLSPLSKVSFDQNNPSRSIEDIAAFFKEASVKALGFSLNMSDKVALKVKNSSLAEQIISLCKSGKLKEAIKKFEDLKRRMGMWLSDAYGNIYVDRIRRGSALLMKYPALVLMTEENMAGEIQR